MAIHLRPTITNSNLWSPERPPKKEWDRIRGIVLERENNRCSGCAHRALKYMNVHHVANSVDNRPENLVLLCVACHAVMHFGRNLSVSAIEIWEAPISQVEIVQQTRAGIAKGKDLKAINEGFGLKRGPHAPNALEYANDLLLTMGNKPTASLPEPLSVVFVKLERWQIDEA